MAKRDILRHRVEFHECDPSACVNIARYFVWFERSRFRIANDIGMQPENDISGDCTFYYPVLDAECEFFEDIPIDAEIAIISELETPVAAKLVFKHTIVNEHTNFVYTKATTIVGVCTAKDGLRWTMPDEIKDKIRKYFTENGEGKDHVGNVQKG